MRSSITYRQLESRCSSTAFARNGTFETARQLVAGAAASSLNASAIPATNRLRVREFASRVEPGSWPDRQALSLLHLQTSPLRAINLLHQGAVVQLLSQESSVCGHDHLVCL